MSVETVGQIWEDDLLGYKSKGEAFTNLVTSIKDHRTISIEAGYGRGKTFFRERWAKQLEAAGECVVQIDARLSDHSGDPVVTFLGALLKLVPEEETAAFQEAIDVGKKIAVASAKVVGRAVLREGLETALEHLSPDDGEVGVFEEVAKAVGKDLSKAAGEAIATQLSAEKSRLDLNEHMKTLHGQITADRDTDRIIIFIDELDRCHPDYAIALLEAMKLVFDQDGFVFVLMVNSEYLENIALHRFGGAVKGEFYLEKFVNLRLKLEADNDGISEATRTLTSNLELIIPFGEHPAFGVEAAAKLGSDLAPLSGLSLRQIKRILERLDLCCRIYSSEHIDLPLLVWLAFAKGTPIEGNTNLFPRAGVTPQKGSQILQKQNSNRNRNGEGRYTGEIVQEINEKYPELLTLGDSQFGTPKDGKDYYPWYQIYSFLAPHYIPYHQSMLDAVHTLQVDS